MWLSVAPTALDELNGRKVVSAILDVDADGTIREIVPPPDYRKTLADALSADLVRFAHNAMMTGNAELLRACVDCYFKIHERSPMSALAITSSAARGES